MRYPVPERGRIKYRRHADGTVTRYSYSTIADPTNPAQTVVKTVTETGAVDDAQLALDATGAVQNLTQGVRTETVTNVFDKVVTTEVHDIASGLLLSSSVVADVDTAGRPLKIIYDGDTDDFEEFTYACCGVETHRARDGSMTKYQKDAAGRPEVTTVLTGVAGTDPDITYIKTDVTTTSYGSDAESGLPKTSVIRTVTAGQGTPVSQSSETVTDLSGRTVLTRSPDANDDGLPDVTSSGHNTATRTTNTTGPDGITHITTTYADGQTLTSRATVGGDQVGPLISYDYEPHNINGGGIKTTITKSGANAVYSTTVSFANLAGRVFKVISPGHDNGELVTTTDFDGRGRVVGTTTTGRAGTVFVPNVLGEIIETRTNINGIEDAVTRTLSDYVTEDDVVCRRTRRWVLLDGDGNNAEGLLVSTTFNSPDGHYQKSQSLGGPVTVTTSNKPLNGCSSSETRTYLAGTSSTSTQNTATLNADGITTVTSVYKNTSGTAVTTATRETDILGRTISVGDGRTPATTYSDFTGSGTPLKTIRGDGTYTLITEMDAAGRPTVVKTHAVDDTLLSTVHTTYHSDGNVAANWGDNTTPTYKFYDVEGRLTELRTYRSTELGIIPNGGASGGPRFHDMGV